MNDVNVATIYLTYLDGQNVDVSIREDGLNNFFECIENGRPYVDTITKCGFYVAKEQIRYVSFKISAFETKEPKPITENEIEENPE